MPKKPKFDSQPPSRTANFQVVWSGVESSCPSLVLQSGPKSYVFNCGEGLQRVLTQKRIKMTNVESFYLTRHQWSHIGGLFGIGLTIRDDSQQKATQWNKFKNAVAVKQRLDNVTNISVRSTPGMANILKASKAWLMYHDEDGVRELKINDSPNRDDGQLRIESVVIHSKADHTCTAEQPTDAIESFTVSSTDTNEPILAFDRSPKSTTAEQPTDAIESFTASSTDSNEPISTFDRSPKSTTAEEPTDTIESFTVSSTDSNEPILTFDHSPKSNIPAMCYVCDFHPLVGKFDTAKAEALGIPSGPLRGKLVRGESVVLKDGRVIKSSDVVSESAPGPICIIVDCPSVSYIESLAASELGSYFSGSKAAYMVFHFTPHYVCKDAAYATWMNNFSANVKHIFLDGLQQKTLPYESQHSLQVLLNRLDSKFFPLVDSVKCTTNNDSSVKNFTKFFVRDSFQDPTKGIDEGDTSPFITMEKINYVLNKVLNVDSSDEGTVVNGKRTLTDKDHVDIPSPKRTRTDTAEDRPRKYPLTVCLGTGSCKPSKYRNVSGTLVFLNDDTAVLLDCGEGTYIEMVRHYGDSVDLILKKIQFIFISHMHPDHHLGLITLVTELNNLRTNNDNLPLIMMPRRMGKWLRCYAETTERMKYRYAWCENSYEGLKMSETIELRSVKVDHPASAHGLVITCSDGLKVTYSGDTMPCEKLINAGMNSTLLIHEATLNDDKEEDALRKKHSTTSQAVDVARQMQAEWVLLTHISQRYPKISVVKENDLLSRTVYASDHMELMLDDIPRFSELVPTLNALNDLLEEEKPFSVPNPPIF